MRVGLLVVAGLLFIATLAGSFYLVYRWGNSSAQQQQVVKENEEYRQTRRQLDEASRATPTNPTDAYDWLLNRQNSRK